MDLYTRTSYALAQQLTEKYSTSFSMASSLFDSSIRKDIYAIYGMVRLADEIVDSYRQPDAEYHLELFHQSVIDAMKSGFSSNPIIHAFANTAQKYHLPKNLIDSFFASMKTDLSARSFNRPQYQKYIYGSAEVVGLLCLHVFTGGNKALYSTLRPSAQALGAAYQKINFLRDIAADYNELGRMYFPGVSFNELSEADTSAIIQDIRADLAVAEQAFPKLPKSARKAVIASYQYYSALLNKIEATPIEYLKNHRVRLSNYAKLYMYAKIRAGL